MIRTKARELIWAALENSPEMVLYPFPTYKSSGCETEIKTLVGELFSNVA